MPCDERHVGVAGSVFGWKRLRRDMYIYIEVTWPYALAHDGEIVVLVRGEHRADVPHFHNTTWKRTNETGS